MSDTITFTIEGFKEAQDFLDPKKFTQAIRSTLDKTGTFAKAQISAEISNRYNFDAGTASKAMSVMRTTMSSLETKLRIVGPRLSLILFNARWGPSGTVSQILRITPHLIPHSFIATMPTGHVDVFVRKQRKRLPIKSLPGPSVADMANAVLSKATAAVNAFIQETFNAEVTKRS
jgi:hypothetical protein